MQQKKGFDLNKKSTGGVAFATPPVSRDSSADLELYAPKAKSVSVAGSFNNWSTTANRLTKDSQGNWKTSIRLKSGQYQYRFFVDGSWTDDPKAKETALNQYGSKNAVLRVK